MMQIIQLIFQNFFSFIAIISFIVFIHEFGHFFVARLCKVQVDVFSIGFGKELFGFTDKKGTRWKFSLIPLGGYVKMFGDKNGASIPDLELLKNMPEADKKKSFLFKNVYQRFAIVAAGPLANFVLTIFLMTYLLKANGLNTILPIIDQIVPDSAAFEAGLRQGDKILAIDETEISDFNSLRQKVAMSANQELHFKIARADKIIAFKITPKYQTTKDFFGEEVKVGMLGVTASQAIHQDLTLMQSVVEAHKETYHITKEIFRAVVELITGKRSVQELGGPIKIAKYSGKTVTMGINVVVWFMAMISLNLGVMNLLPVPGLDGGHLFYYLIEMVRRKPLSHKTQMAGFQVGMALLLALMIFTTYNDLRQLIGG